MNIDDLINAISSERLHPYRTQGDSDHDALERYKNNILLSEALYPCLHMLEIVLRNRLEAVLIDRFGDTWYQNPELTNQMMSKSQMKPEGKQLRQAKRNLRNQPHKQVASGRVVAELNFGFWTALLGRAYEDDIWRPYDFDIFPNTQPADRDIKTIRVNLRDIRKLRNRIFHHEPIWNDPHLQSKHAAITRLLSWLNADAATYLGRCDRFSEVHKRVGVGSNRRDLN